MQQLDMRQVDTSFAAQIEEYRRELRLHCYRMLGSALDAEDAIQETMLRAWRYRGSFRGVGAIRAWLYRIATNVCRDMLAQRAPRSLPIFSVPPVDPRGTETSLLQDLPWLTPIPDEWLVDDAPGPDAVYSARESVALAFLILMQTLPPRQRTALLLRDAAGWSAKEVADVLGSTPSSVESALHRARTTISARRDEYLEDQREAGFVQAGQRDLLEQYALAWEAGDIETLLPLLSEDAAFTMPPVPTWYKGRAAIGAFLAEKYAQFRFHLQPTTANGLPAFAIYKGAPDGGWVQHGIQVVLGKGRLITEMHTFLAGSDDALFRIFGFPAHIAPP